MNLAKAAGPPASSIAFSSAGSRDCSVVMPELKHCFTSNVKQYLIPNALVSVDNQGMLDSIELARRLKIAMDTCKPRVSSSRLADACDVTPQAVNGWRNTGRIAKRHLSTIARETKRPYEYFLDEASANSANLPLKAEDSGKTTKPYIAESPEVSRLIIAFGWLTDDEKKKILADLESKAETNKTISRQLGPRWEFKSDDAVGVHIKAAPNSADAARQLKKTQKASGRPPSAAMDDIPED